MKTLKEQEKEHILNALDILHWNKTQTAKALGISLKTLYNKLETYEVDAPILPTMPDIDIDVRDTYVRIYDTKDLKA